MHIHIYIWYSTCRHCETADRHGFIATLTRSDASDRSKPRPTYFQHFHLSAPVLSLSLLSLIFNLGLVLLFLDKFPSGFPELTSLVPIRIEIDLIIPFQSKRFTIHESFFLLQMVSHLARSIPLENTRILESGREIATSFLSNSNPSKRKKGYPRDSRIHRLKKRPPSFDFNLSCPPTACIMYLVRRTYPRPPFPTTFFRGVY